MSERSRLSQIRRSLLSELQQEVKFHIGPLPPSLRRYYEQYKDEFTGRCRSSSKEGLIGEVRTPSFQIEKGALFQGQSRMPEEEPPAEDDELPELDLDTD